MHNIMTIDSVQMQLESFREAVESVLQQTKQVTVTNRQEAQRSINYIARARSLSEDITNKKLYITKDHREYVTKVNSIANEFTEALASIETMLLSKIDSWKAIQAERCNNIEEAEIMAPDFDFESVSAFEELSTVKSQEATAYEETTYSYVIQDIQQVPLAFLTINEEVFQAAMKSGIRNIAGLKISQKTQTKVRRKHNVKMPKNNKNSLQVSA